MNLIPFFTSLFIIATAELGDKTQLLTFGFATKYSIWKVMSAVFTATAVLSGLAVIFGSVITKAVPTSYVQLISGIVFILFGLWTIFGKEEEEEVEAKNNKSQFLIIFSAFFLAELGDKTQLATLALAAKYGTPVQVWLGATLGMAGVNIIGALLGSRVRELEHKKTIKLLGAAVFIIFGLLTLFQRGILFSN